MIQITEFSSCTLDQEPDTIIVLPSHLDLVVIGTYHLQDQDDTFSGTSRTGSLQVLRIHPGKSQFEVVSRLDLPFGVYDIRLHPANEDLLGVATSHAEILLCSLVYSTNVENMSEPTEIALIGKVIVEDSTESQIPIITQLKFVNDSSIFTSSSDEPDTTSLCIVATTQLGNTKIIQTVNPEIVAKEQSLEDIPILDAEIIQVHKQSMDLEAWSVTSIPLPNRDLLIISGGDDSRMIASTCVEAEDEATITKSFTDSRTHQAGVVSLLHVDTIQDSHHDEQESQTSLLLSGSYDEVLRLFSIDTSSPVAIKPMLLAELKLPGGVWRIDLVDSYHISEEHAAKKNYILLISAHLVVAFIVRLEGTSNQGTSSFTFDIEAEFTVGHGSLVYACVATCTGRTGKGKKKYSIISTSFYDKKVCNWEWVDERAP